MLRIKQLGLLIILVLAGLLTYGQSVPNPTDTSYVMSLLKKAEAIETSQPETALKNYQKAFAFSQKINFTKGYFESMRLLTYQLNNMGRHDEARKIALAAVQKAKQDTSNRNLGLSYFAVANTALFKDQYKEAIPNYLQAILYMRKTGSRRNVAVIYQNLGQIYKKQGMYEQALNYYYKALAVDSTMTKDKADRRSIANDYFSIGGVYSAMGKNRETMAYYRKASQWVDPKTDIDFMISLYNNMGYQYIVTKQYDSSVYYRRESLRLSRVINNPRHELHALMALAQSHTMKGEYQRAKKLLDQAIPIAEKTKAALGEFSNIYREYVLVNYALENYKTAIEWMDKYKGIEDSLRNTQTSVLLQEYELKLKQAEAGQKLAQKQRNIDQLQADKKRQNLWLLIAGLIGLVVLSALVFAFLYTRQRKRTADNALIAAQREHELAVVQSELAGQQKERQRISKEMHDDLGASLTAIGLLSEVVKSRMGTHTTPEVEKISSISSEMVTSMNEIIWSLNNKNDSLNGLIAYTRAYASEFIENAGLELKTDVVEAKRELSIRGVDRRNVFLTVKEALNNVVKHAGASAVRLVMRAESSRLWITVADNGTGFERSERTALRNGLGNMAQRMAESGGSCEITSSSDGTIVQITYPYAGMI